MGHLIQFTNQKRPLDIRYYNAKRTRNATLCLAGHGVGAPMVPPPPPLALMVIQVMVPVGVSVRVFADAGA